MVIVRDVNKDLTSKDQDKDKDLTPKDQDKDKDLLDLTPKDQDKDKDLKYVLKEFLRTRTRTTARQIILFACLYMIINCIFPTNSAEQLVEPARCS